MPKQKTIRLGDSLSSDDIDELIGPVCTLAEMPTTGRDADFDALIKAARIIKAREGFAVHTMSLTD